jgi:tetratricopeptide (TPR) repeat protein
MPRTPRYITSVPELEVLPDQDLLDWLDRRSADLQTAVAAVYTARRFDLTVQLVDALWPLLLRRRNTALWLTVVGAYGLPAAEKEAARTDLGEQQQAVARCMVRRMHTTLGGGLRDAGRLDEALEHYEQARHSALADDHLRDRAQALDGIGAVHQAAGRSQQALAPLDEALRIREEIRYSRGAALTRIRLGEAVTDLGRHREAVEYLLTARVALRQERDIYDAARALAFMGRTYLRAERWGEGDQHLVSALKEFDAAGAGLWAARTTEWRAEGAVQRGRSDAAKARYAKARALYAAAGRDRPGAHR